MRSQQESCCGLAFTGLNGLKLIWNSALALIAGEFSHIKHQVVSPSRLELKLLFEFASGAPASSCLAVQKLLPGMSHIVIESLYSHTKSEFNTQYKCRFFNWAGSGVRILPTGAVGADDVVYF